MIPVITTNRDAAQCSVPKRNQQKCNNITIKRCNKLLDAVQLPVIANINPRSIYNKATEFKTMIEQLDVSLCFMSESWDRDYLGVEEVIKMDGFKIIKNVLQRSGQGGKPALIVSEKNYHIKELCPDTITVPPNVEAVWALLTPKAGGSQSNIKHIAVCSYYYTAKTKRSEFVDHVSEAFNKLSAKYGPGLHFILGGDTNRLNLKSILNLSPKLKQLVQVPTRCNPDAILDTIISTLGMYYLSPCTMPPLDNDDDKDGKPSDHLIVLMRPINADEPKRKSFKNITFRPLPESGLFQFGVWLKMQKWESVIGATSAHDKAKILQSLLIENLDKFLPQKTIRICSEDQPWYTEKLKKMSRRMKREYTKNKKSESWKKMILLRT